jgi:tetratricopeptide (TPR) repeat protein
MADMYAYLNQLDEAINEYKKVLEYDFSSSVLHQKLALLYLKKGSFDLATDELKLALKYDPKGLETHYLLTMVYLLQNKYELAKEKFEDFLKTAIELNPSNFLLYHSLGEFYLQQNRFKEAEDIYKFILKNSKEDRKAHLMLADIYIKEKKINEAVKEYREILKLNPDDHVALNALGYLYAENGINLDEAEILIKKALEFEPHNGAYLDSLGWVHYQKNQIDLAIKELKEASELCEDPVIYEHLGDAYFRNGQIKEAKETWEKALELNPKNLDLKNKLEKLNSLK